jgi:wyosine [tRNA(Phe)-imidazoG37] synthetase (radical SAM superfamily)
MLTKTPPSSAFFSTGDVVKAIEVALNINPRVDYLTLSGNGEPTLHPDFPEIIKEVSALRDLIRPDIKIAVFSNSSMLENELIRESLRLVDLPILKLDAGDEEIFQKIDQPATQIHLETIVAMLALMKQVVIQSMFINGNISNCRGKPYENLLKVVQRIKPRSIQVYTTDRQIPKFNLTKVTPQKLIAIAEDIKTQTGTDTTAYWS